MPIHESFGTFSKPGVISGWDPPVAGSLPIFSSVPISNPTYEFIDFIGIRGRSPGPNNPEPTFSGAWAPFLYNTLLMSAPQSWYVGGEASGSGTNVFNGTIEYYRDHAGAHQ